MLAEQVRWHLGSFVMTSFSLVSNGSWIRQFQILLLLLASNFIPMSRNFELVLQSETLTWVFKTGHVISKFSCLLFFMFYCMIPLEKNLLWEKIDISVSIDCKVLLRMGKYSLPQGSACLEYFTEAPIFWCFMNVCLLACQQTPLMLVHYYAATVFIIFSA